MVRADLGREEAPAQGMSTKHGIRSLLDPLRQRDVRTAVATSRPARRTRFALRAAGMRVIVIPGRHEPSRETRALAAAVHDSADAALPAVLELLAP
jgi:beta-phosphoglucomutase-like phosphatase (HAD superfamily)